MGTLAHGSGLEFIPLLMVAAAYLIGWLLAVGVGATLAGVVFGTLTLKVSGRKRHVIWAAPLLAIVLFLLINPVPRTVSIWGESFAVYGFVRVLGVACAGLSGLVAAGLVVTFAAGAVGMGDEGQSAMPGPPPELQRGGLYAGFVAPAEGFLYMRRNPRLWRYAVTPIALSLLVTGVVLLLMVLAGVWFAVKMRPWLEQKLAGVFGAGAIQILAAVGVFVLVIGLAIAMWVVLSGALCGHFYGRLAEKVERQLGLRDEEIRDVPLGQEIADSLRALGSLVLVNGGVLLLNFIPIAGTIAAMPLGLYLNTFIFGYEYMDIPMSLRGMRRAEKRAIARAHRWETAGLGASAFTLNFAPLVGQVLQAGAVVGAVLMFRRWQAAGKVGSVNAMAAAT